MTVYGFFYRFSEESVNAEAMTSDGLSTATAVGVGVAVGVVLLVLIALVIVFILYR